MNSQPIGRTPIGHPSTAGASQPKPAPDPVFSGLARLACGACGASFASMAVLGYRDAWFTATAEVPAAAVPRQDPFAPYAAQSEGLFEVPDTATDDRFRDSEAVTGALGIRSYAGCALRTPTGEALGTLAVYGTAPRSLSVDQRGSLRLLAEQAVAGIELRSRLSEFVLLAAAPGVPVPPSDAATAAARALLDSAPVAIYHTDAAGNMSYSNPEYRRIFGLKPDQSTDTWAQRVHPDDRERMEQAWTEFCRLRVPSRFAYRTLTGDGAIRHFSEQVVAANGMPGWVGTITDFTDLVAARDEFAPRGNLVPQHLRSGAARHRVCRSRRQIPAFQSGVLRDAGFRCPATSRTRRQSISPARRILARVAADLARLWSGEMQFVDLEKRYTRKDGSLIWVRTTTSLVRESDASAEYSVEFLRDVSARKEAAEELERVHKQLMTASRQAGMAEVATNVLHNVGNILNSINISASLVIERIKQSKTPGVTRLAALLHEKGAGVGDFIANDERGKRIPEYLVSLGEQLTSDQKMALEELASLRDNLEHIKDTVAMQQSYAKLCGVTETIAVVDLVEDSLRLNAGAFVRHGVTLQRDFAEVPADHRRQAQGAADTRKSRAQCQVRMR
jgi:PAS domain S-box-containing protein